MLSKILVLTLVGLAHVACLPYAHSEYSQTFMGQGLSNKREQQYDYEKYDQNALSQITQEKNTYKYTQKNIHTTEEHEINKEDHNKCEQLYQVNEKDYEEQDKKRLKELEKNIRELKHSWEVENKKIKDERNRKRLEVLKCQQRKREERKRQQAGEKDQVQKGKKKFQDELAIDSEDNEWAEDKCANGVARGDNVKDNCNTGSTATMVSENGDIAIDVNSTRNVDKGESETYDVDGDTSEQKYSNITKSHSHKEKHTIDQNKVDVKGAARGQSALDLLDKLLPNTFFYANKKKI